MTSLRRAVGVLAVLATAAAPAVVATGYAAAAPAARPAAGPAGAGPSAAGVPASAHVVRSPGTGLVRFVGTEPGHRFARPAGVDAHTAPRDAARAFLSAHRGLFGIADPAGDLAAGATAALPGGGHVARFTQRVAGHPVVGGEVAVALAPDNTVASVEAATVAAAPSLTAPRLTAAQAARTAARAVARDAHVRAGRLAAAVPSLAVYDPALLGVPTGAPTALVYRVEVTSRPGAAAPVRRTVLVDAAKGVVALDVDRVERAALPQVCDAGDSTAVVDPTCPPTTGDGTQPALVDPAPGSEGDLARQAAQATYDFYAGVVGDASRVGVPGAGGAAELNLTVRYCDPTAVDAGGSQLCPMPGAFWDGHEAVYGDGFAAADDVVAHELTHGVTEHGSDLFYLYQSGAINESMSDVMGELVDQLDGIGTDGDGYRWMLGEDLPADFGVTRDMRDPTTAPAGVPAAGFTPQPDRMTSPLYAGGYGSFGLSDSGGVHTNSGVGNKAAFLVVDGGDFNGVHVPGLGGATPGQSRTDALTKAAKIYYAADTMLTSGADYADLSEVLPQACRNLVGVAAGSGAITAGDCATVAAAVTATEMNRHRQGTAPLDAPTCTGGYAVSTDWFDDLENTASGRWARSSASGPWYYPAGRNIYGDMPQSYATSGEQELWGDDPDPAFLAEAGVSAPWDGTVAMTKAVHVPVGKPAYLRYDQAYLFDWSPGDGAYYDGGRVEYTVDGGAHWLSAQRLFPSGTFRTITGYDYDTDGGLLRMRYQFAGIGGDSQGYGSARLDLSPLAGKYVRFRFRVTADGEFGGYGWYIDDVRFYTCGARPAAPTGVTVRAGVGQLPVTWRAPSDHGTSAVTGYRLTLRSGSTVLRSVGVGPAARSWTFTRLPGGRALTASVAAVNVAGTGSAARTRTLAGSALSLAASRSAVVPGHRVTLAGRLVRAGTSTGLAGKHLGLYRARVGSTAWSYVTSATTSRTGGYAFHPVVRATYAYRVQFAGAPYYQGGVSAARTVRAG